MDMTITPQSPGRQRVPGPLGVNGDAPVRLSTSYKCNSRTPLFRLFLELLGGGGEIGVLIAEELVGDLPR